MIRDTEDVVARIAKIRTERKEYYNVEGDEVDLLLAAVANLIQSLSDRIDVLEGALKRIAAPYAHGHCETCGTPCNGIAECDCQSPTWAPDDPADVARAALHQEGIA